MTTIEDSLNCIEVQKENGTHNKDTMIGRVIRDYQFFDAKYLKGMHVLYRQDQDGSLVLEMPLSPQSIMIQRNRGSKQTTCYVVWNVPSDFVEKVEFAQ
ncbi:MAG: hypothetical protein AABX10_00845 [Nanoarchaeota archaeon]